MRARSRGIGGRALVLCVALLGALVANSGSGFGQERQDGRAGAGPRAVAHRAGGRAVDSKSLTARAPRPLFFRVGRPAGEPTLGITREGWVFYMAAPGGNNTDVWALRSKDEGATWDDVTPRLGPVSRHPYDFDPYMYVDDKTSRVFIDNLGPLTCSNLSFSDDRGETWTTNPIACGRPVNDHQTIFAGPPVTSETVGYPNVVYYCFQDVAAAWCSKSLDGGLTFLPPASPAYSNVQSCGGIGAAHGHGVVGPEGTVYLPTAQFCGRPAVAISDNEGVTWSQAIVASEKKLIGAEYHEAGVAVDAKGNLYFTWVAQDRLPYVAFSRNDGATWSEPMMIGPPGLTEANLPGIDVGAPGKIAVVYMGSSNSPFPRCGTDCETADYAKTTWNGYVTVADDLFAKDPVFFSASVNDPRDPLARQTCGPGRCGPGNDFLDVVIGSDGTPWAAFVDLCISVCPEPTGVANDGQDGIAAHIIGGPRLK